MFHRSGDHVWCRRVAVQDFAGVTSIMLLSLLIDAGWACGQTTHIWTVLHAIEHLPDGPLKQQLASDEARQALISGAMFPDGGYSPLVNHPYGETAHWEPFQDRYLQFVRAQHPDDARYAAFLYGMAGHGIGDQYFDGAYLYRGGEGQRDQDTDVVIASLWGGHDANQHFVPYDELVPLFGDAGVPVDADTLRNGMASLDLAVLVVGRWGQNPDEVAKAKANAPWQTAHLEDPTLPGAPVCLGKTIAAYWQVLAARLDGDALPSWVIGSFPEEGAYEHPTHGVDGMLSVVFARSVRAASIDGRVILDGPTGPVPAAAWMYYGDATNVLNVLPETDLSEDTAYTLRLLPGIETIGGDVLDAEWQVAFSTGPAPKSASGCDHVGEWGLGLGLAAAVVMRRRARD
jgi:hypothetical protein